MSGKKQRLNIRLVAMETLLAWEGLGAVSIDAMVQEKIKYFEVEDSRDQSLIKALVYGVVRWRSYLDAIIGKFSQHPVKKMKPATLAALRVGLFQIVFLDRIPASAAINETVDALKRKKQPAWLSGFVNGLLRNVERNKGDLPDPFSESSVLAGHPQWLIDRWQKHFGRDRTISLCKANNEPPPLVLRVNSRRTTVEILLAEILEVGYGVEKGFFSGDALRISNFYGQIAEIPGYHEGYFQVQDEAAQLVTELLRPFAAADYLDACAGVGGKTTHLAQLLPEGGQIVAVEPEQQRLALLEENLARLGFSEKVRCHNLTLEEYCLGCLQKFKGILVDAPCSGLGVIRRHPEIRWLRSKQDLLQNQEKQLALLDKAASLLEDGGVLVYATCSTEPEENQEVVSKFLAKHQDFRIANAKEFLPERAACLVDVDGFLRTTPDQGVDGFFAARLVKY